MDLSQNATEYFVCQQLLLKLSTSQIELLASSQSNETFNLGGQQQMFMGVRLCTGPRKWKELQVVMLGVDEGESTADSSTFSAPQDIIAIEYLHWEEYKVTA